MNRTLQFVLALVIVSGGLTGCAGTEPGTRARVSLGAEYPRSQALRVLLLSVKVEGKPDVSEDLALTDAFAQHLLGMGYRVIDKSQARTRAKEMGILTAGAQALSDNDVMQVARELGIDAVAKGRLTLAYVPGRAESGTKVETLTRTEIRNGTHRKDTVTIREDVPTNYSYSTEGRYAAVSQSLNIVAVPSGEIWLTATVENDSDYDMTEELAAGIRRAFK